MSPITLVHGDLEVTDGVPTPLVPLSCIMVVMMDASRPLLEKDIVSLDVRWRDRLGRLIKFMSMLA